jgi:YHS domain-containing protein
LAAGGVVLNLRAHGREARFEIEGIFRRPDRVMMKDPVCEMMVDETKTKLRSEHGGKLFYFCSVACKAAFDYDPHKYGHPK